MEITVIGATGTVGSRVTAEATTRGHHVRAVSRGSGPARPGVTPVAADVGSPRALADAVTGADAVVLAVRPAAGHEGSIVGLTEPVLDAAAAAGVPLIVIGGAGSLRTPDNPAALVADDERYVPRAWRAVAAASTAQLRACERRPEVDWTYLSPPAVLEPGERTGRYRRGTTTLLTADDGSSRISVEDLAVAVVDEVENPGGERRITVSAS